MNKALIILLLFIGFITYQNWNKTFYLSSGELCYKSYMMKLEGGLTAEKEEYLEAENNRYQEAFREMELIDAKATSGVISEQAADSLKLPFSKVVSFYPVFQRVWEKFDYIKYHPEEEFVYETGYYKLFGLTDNSNIAEFLELELVMIVCLSFIFSMEYKNNALRLIASTPRGRKEVVRKKLLISLVIVSGCFLAVFVSRIVRIAKYYPLHRLWAYVTSLIAYEKLPKQLPIIIYLTFVFLVQLVTCLVVAMVILMISYKVKSNIQGMYLSLLILVLPIILSMMGLDTMRFAGILPLYLIARTLLARNGLLIIISYVGIGIVVLVLGWKRLHARRS
jgi:hypothetical protein